MRKLLKKDSEWFWENTCEKSFNILKTILSSDSCVTYFDNEKETVLYTDASPVGISAILMQKTPGKENNKIISYSSRSLTTAEQNYSQIERECLSLVFGCERNRLFLLGRHFDLYNDHKALMHILNNPRANVPLRIERLTLRLQGYDFTLKHVMSEQNIADYSSRHPYRAKTDELSTTESYINFVANYQCPKALTLDHIKRNET